jgi:hypothetical protein
VPENPINRVELLKRQCRLGAHTACLTLEALDLARRQADEGERQASAGRLDEQAPRLDERGGQRAANDEEPRR